MGSSTPIMIRRTVAYPAKDLFSIISDIEAYPQFIPNCTATRITARRGNEWLVDNIFRLGPVPLNFRTRAVLDPPHGIAIRSIDTGVIDLALKWQFSEGVDGTEMIFEMVLDIPGPAFLLTRTLQHQAEEIEAAFLKRAASLLD